MTAKTSSARLTSIARIGEWAVTAALVFMLLLGIHGLWQLIGNPVATSAALLNDFDLTPRTTLPILHLSVAALFWAATDIVGVFIFLTARALFKGYRRGQVFTIHATEHLARIGWLVVALAPVRMIFDMAAILTATLSNPSGSRQVTLALEDGDVYAVVIGLILVAVSHILIEAIRLADENRAFV